ncbi:unnamed protein product [Rotaria socialis]|uniref:cAMP-dependent protein kinase n=1 Tax=Rotaria socialis TaxID=392032 RepID=A0A819ZQ24_9BILA|nr:unnamed protein product [Rotaria socialis]CAF3507815.1 unnamed protein product [Rotaria socialis]CAF4180951.1 unnamed protein product [Rotaria socialis]CAF4489169.1 unnamed protein product [Rotaria socialis]
MGNCSSSPATQVSSSETRQVEAESQSKDESEVNIDLKHAKQEFEAKYAQSSKQTVNIEDFQLGRTLGTGAFGYVVLAKYENRSLALKIMEKHVIVELGQVEHILSEKHILQAINFPFIVTFICAFKDNAHLYLALEFASGGEMFVHFRNMTQLPEDQVQFYASQIVLAFEYLHNLNIIYRNLKVEEILFEADGYLKLTDFGLAKVVQERTYTLCGTPEYLAPEIITGIGYNKSVDYWTLGILIYELTAGATPFHDEDPTRIFKKILQGSFNIPGYFASDIRDLLSKLLQTRPLRRYGNLQNGVDDIKNHPWFSSINWESLLKKRIKAPYIPEPDKDHYETYEEKKLIHAETELYPTEFDSF